MTKRVQLYSVLSGLLIVTLITVVVTLVMGGRGFAIITGSALAVDTLCMGVLAVVYVGAMFNQGERYRLNRALVFGFVPMLLLTWIVSAFNGPIIHMAFLVIAIEDVIMAMILMVYTLQLSSLGRLGKTPPS